MILLVEDDDTLRAGAVSALEALGYSVLAAPNEQTAIELYQAHRPEIDVIVSDVLPPDRGCCAINDAVRRDGTTVRLVFPCGEGVRAADVMGELGSDVPLLTEPWRLGEIMRAVGVSVRAARTRSGPNRTKHLRSGQRESAAGCAS